MGHVQAQNGTVFPVDLNVTLTPPYGPCLDDYVGIGGNRFLCNVLFRDQMKDKTSPVFEYVIEMRVRTMGGSTMIKAWSEDHKAVLGAVEHFDGGRLMREFLSETNHTGGSTCLKEGPYTMTFRVYDAVSYNHGRGKGIPISQEFSFSVFVDKGAAPELFNPANKERLSTTTQMVNFQWQLPYVASGMNTYKFVLARIPQGGNANTDIDNPSYQIRNESVNFPMVQVPVTTLFGYEAQGDGSYAWQVTVCDAEGKQRTNYENQGKSKVFTFTFNDEVWLPDSFVTVAPFVKSINKNLDKLTIDSVEVDNETGAARWTNANLGDADTYHGSIIEVRKKGQDKWTPYIADELKSGDDEQQLPNLKKGVEYEARGQYYQMDNGDTVYAPYGEIVPFTVPSDIDTMNCADDLPALTDCGDAQPKEIHPGDTIIANGKRVFVDSVSYNGDRLSGSGHLDFPIIKCFKFRMQFKNIKVNCAGELVDGEITSVYDMTNAFILDLNNLTGKGNTGDETFNSTEPTVSKVKDLDNAKKTKQPGDYFEVEGEPNVIYSLDKDKNPVKIGTKLANWTSDTFTHANKMYNNEILLKFSNDRKNQGFDSSEEPYRLMAPSKYESVDGYWVPWLASNPGRVCVVKAKLEGGSISNVKDPEHDVKFIMPLSDGGLMELNTQYNAGSGEFEITVMGSSKAGDKLEIYAVIKKTDGKNEEYVDAGRLYVPIYEYRTLKMTVVKVNGANASAVDKSSIESYLNEVYGRIGISFEVTVEEFQSEEAKAFLEDGLDVCGAGGFMTATTNEMRQLKSLYMDSKGGSVDEKRLYLFLVNKAQCTEEDSKIDPSAVCGDMPRNSKVGYLFAENAGGQASFNRTVAHELGHGAFTYEHPFDNAAYTVEQGTTHNLMDYVKDDDLAYFQWQSTLGLNLTWGFLEGDEDGMMIAVSDLKKLSINILSVDTAFAPGFGSFTSTFRLGKEEEALGEKYIKENIRYVCVFKNSKGDVLNTIKVESGKNEITWDGYFENSKTKKKDSLCRENGPYKMEVHLVMGKILDTWEKRFDSWSNFKDYVYEKMKDDSVNYYHTETDTVFNIYSKEEAEAKALELKIKNEWNNAADWLKKNFHNKIGDYISFRKSLLHYIPEFEKLDSPLDYFAENIIIHKFLGRDLRVNKAFVPVLNAVEETLKGNNMYDDLKEKYKNGMTSFVPRVANNSGNSSQEYPILSNHSYGSAIDFIPKKNPQIESRSKYVCFYIKQLTGFDITKGGKTVDKIKNAHDSFKEHFTDIDETQLENLFNDLNDYENDDKKIKPYDIESINSLLKKLSPSDNQTISEETKKDIVNKLSEIIQIIPTYSTTMFINTEAKDQGELLIKKLEEIKKDISIKHDLILEKEYSDFIQGINTFKENQKTFSNENLKSFGNKLAKGIKGIGFGSQILKYGFCDIEKELVNAFLSQSGVEFGGTYKKKIDPMHIGFTNATVKEKIKLQIEDMLNTKKQ